MATVLDALVVTLTMNAKGFKQGAAEVDDSLTHTREESAKTAREMEARGKQAAMFFSKVRNEALALLAVFTAGMGLKNFVSSTVESTASLARMSDNLNMSAKDLAEWQLAAKNAGGSVEGITAQLRESADQVAKFKRGMAAETLPAFFQFGGKTEDLKDGNTYLQARARIVAEIYKSDRARAALAANMMGLDAQQFNLYKEGPEGIARRRREQSGPAAEQAAAAARAEQLRQKYDTAMNKLSSVGVNVLTSMMPSFDFIVAKLIELGDWIIANKAEINEGVQDFVSGFEKILKAITDAVKQLMPEKVRKAEDPAKAFMDNNKEMLGEFLTPSWLKSKPKAPDAMRYDDPKLNDYATKVERDNNLPSGLLNAIKNKGEKSNSDQVSPAGAKGVMQFMPGTWRQYGKGDITNPYDSIDAAGRYFVDLMKRYNGSVDAAITEYNGGIKQARAVQAGGSPTATETINYLARVKEGLNANAALSSVNVAHAAQPLAQSVNNATSTTTTNSSETHFHGDIHVATAATDGAGIARDLAGMGRNQNLVQQGNTGLF